MTYSLLRIFSVYLLPNYGEGLENIQSGNRKRNRKLPKVKMTPMTNGWWGRRLTDS